MKTHPRSRALRAGGRQSACDGARRDKMVKGSCKRTSWGCWPPSQVNWKSPELGLLDTIRFTNSLRLDHADGTRTELDANVNVNSILQASSASMDVELKAKHTGKGFEVGGTARVVISEAGAQKADLALFASTKRRLSGGRTLRSAIFLDVAAIPGDGGQRLESVLASQRSQLETAGSLRVDRTPGAGWTARRVRGWAWVPPKPGLPPLSPAREDTELTANARVDSDWGVGWAGRPTWRLGGHQDRFARACVCACSKYVYNIFFKCKLKCGSISIFPWMAAQQVVLIVLGTRVLTPHFLIYYFIYSLVPGTGTPPFDCTPFMYGIWVGFSHPL